MNLFQLVLKQMRQRALSTWLTLLSVTLGVGLAIAIMVFQREGEKLFGQSDFGYDLIVGPKGSSLQLVLNTVYHLDVSQGLIPYSIYKDFMPREHGETKARPNMYVRAAWPIAVGDEYKGMRVVGTIPQFFPQDHEGTKYDEGRVFQYRQGKPLQFADGRPFHPSKFEAVVGAEAARRTGLKMGERFQVQHGVGPGAGSTPDEHDEQWTVVGILKPTYTAADRAIYIPLISFYAIPTHEDSLEIQALVRQGLDPQLAERVIRAQKIEVENRAREEQEKNEQAQSAATKPVDDHEHDHDQAHEKPATAPATTQAKPDAHDDPDHEHKDEKPATSQASADKEGAADDDHEGHDHHQHAYHMHGDEIHLDLPQEQWQLSAIIVRTRGGFQQQSLMYRFRNSTDAMAAPPAQTMADFFRSFLEPSSQLLFYISLLVTVVAAASILVSIYNSVSARLKEIAILRALGATRTRVLLLICLEAALIGLVGGLLGMVLGHALAGISSSVLEQKFGEGIAWLATGRWEWVYLGIVVLLAMLAGLVPALKAYRTPVATNLVG